MPYIQHANEEEDTRCSICGKSVYECTCGAEEVYDDESGNSGEDDDFEEEDL